MMVDIGGSYKDIDTDRQFLDVIEDKISPEFAEIIRQKLANADEEFEDLKDENKWMERQIDGYVEALQSIKNLSEDFIEVTKSTKLCPNQVIEMFKEIYKEAYNAV